MVRQPRKPRAETRQRWGALEQPYEVFQDRRQRNMISLKALRGEFNPSAGEASLPERAVQRRLQRLGFRLNRRMAELGGDPSAGEKSGVGRVVTVDGVYAQELNGVAMPNGAVIIKSGSVARADAVGRVMAAATNSRGMLDDIARVVEGRDLAETTVDRKTARRHADGMLALLIAHEQGHVARDHAQQLIGRHGKGEAPRSFRVRSFEATADVIGVELALREGHSPLGIAGLMLYFTASDVLESGQVRPFNQHDQHPNGVERYRNVYNQLAKRLRARGRYIYGASEGPTLGAPYGDARARAELARLPLPAEVEAWAADLAASGRRLRAQRLPPRRRY